MAPVTTQKQPSKFEQALQSAVQWIRTHQEQFWAITGTVIAAGLIIFFMVHRRQEENENAWTQLGVAQGYLMQNQFDQTAKALDQWAGRYKGTSAETYSRFMRADLLYGTSQYAQAAQIYGDLAQTARPLELRPLALSAQAAATEMAGKLPEAQAAAQQFVDKYPEHFLAASMYLSQARLAEMTGNATGASAIYDRYLILYSQSPWTAFARARLQALGAATPSPAKK